MSGTTCTAASAPGTFEHRNDTESPGRSTSQYPAAVAPIVSQALLAVALSAVAAPAPVRAAGALRALRPYSPSTTGAAGAAGTRPQQHGEEARRPAR